MANPEKGEVSFDALGKTWVVRFTTNSLCELEDHLGKTTGEIVSALQGANGVSVKMLRAILWGGLIDRQPETKLAESGGLVDAIGFAAVSDAIGRAFQLAFPDDEPTSDHPPKGSKAGKPS